MTTTSARPRNSKKVNRPTGSTPDLAVQGELPPGIPAVLTSQGGDANLEQLDRLAGQINQLHRSVCNFHRRALHAAVQAGDLLIGVKQLLDYGHFGTWIQENLDVGDREARRYMQLAKKRFDLDQKHPGWLETLTITDALALVGEPHGEESDGAGSEPIWSLQNNTPETGPAGHQAGASQPRSAEELFEKAKAAHMRRIDDLRSMPGLISMSLGSNGRLALREMRAAIVLAARDIAGRVTTPAVKRLGFDVDAVAMRIVVELLEGNSVPELFEPREEDFVTS